MSYKCSCCGNTHDTLPDIAFDAPVYVEGIPENERESRVRITEDLCSIDEEHYFIRCVLQIRIKNSNENFGFGIWVSQSKQNFEKYIENFDSDQIGPFFGWVSNNIDYKGESILSIKSMVHFLGNEQRPIVEIEESSHPLYLDYREGITMDEAWELAHLYLGDRI